MPQQSSILHARLARVNALNQSSDVGEINIGVPFVSH